jgi:hypothetical protein
MFGFFIEEIDMPIDVQRQRNELTSIRLGKVSRVLSEKNPSILPFKGDLPLIGINSLDNYIDLYSETEKFQFLPRFLKNIVYKAEQIVYYDNLFIDFLSVQDISKNQFRLMTPKEKLDTLNYFLDSQQVNISILQIKDYE